jgi:hypothetical protein
LPASLLLFHSLHFSKSSAYYYMDQSLKLTDLYRSARSNTTTTQGRQYFKRREPSLLNASL